MKSIKKLFFAVLTIAAFIALGNYDNISSEYFVQFVWGFASFALLVYSVSRFAQLECANTPDEEI